MSIPIYSGQLAENRAAGIMSTDNHIKSSDFRHVISVNQKAAIALGITNIAHAHIFAYLINVAEWARPIDIDGALYFWVARQRIASDLPLLDIQEDRVYRHLKALDALKLIEYRKKGKMDCIRITEKGMTYALISNNHYVGESTDIGAMLVDTPNVSDSTMSANSTSSFNHAMSLDSPTVEERYVGENDENRGENQNSVDSPTNPSLSYNYIINPPLTPPSKEDEANKLSPVEINFPQDPFWKIAKLYEEICPTLPAVKNIDFRMQADIRSLESSCTKDEAGWREYFARVAASDYLTGQINGFKATLFWLLKPANYTKVVNGNFDNKSKKTVGSNNRGFCNYTADSVKPPAVEDI